MAFLDIINKCITFVTIMIKTSKELKQKKSLKKTNQKFWQFQIKYLPLHCEIKKIVIHLNISYYGYRKFLL